MNDMEMNPNENEATQRKRLFSNENKSKCTTSEADSPKRRLFSRVDTDKNTISEEMHGKRLFSNVDVEKYTAVEEAPRKRLFSRVESAKEKMLEALLSENDMAQNHVATAMSSQPIKPNCPVTACVSEETSTVVEGNIIVEVAESQQNFDLILKKIIKKISDTRLGEKTAWEYEWEIYMRGRKITEVRVSTEDVSRFKWVKDASRGTAIYKNKEKPFDEYISQLILNSTVEMEVIYLTNGWKKVNGAPVYIYDKGNIGNKIEGIKGNGEFQFKYCKEAVGTKDIFDEVLKMLEICSDHKITLPLFLFAHVGVLTTLFEESGNPVKFMLAVIGETNSRKTSLALCMTKIFNRQAIQEPEVTFSSTEGGLEKAIGTHPDCVLTIDDFMPAATRAKQAELDKKLEKITRMYGDRKGIERMTDFARNPYAGYYPVRGVGIITGEHIHGVKSSLTRHLILDIKDDSVKNEILRYHQRNWKILTTHLYDFIVWITENYWQTVEHISTKMDYYRTEKISKYPRYTEMYGVLCVTAEIFLTYAQNRGFLNEEQTHELLMEWQGTILQVIRSNENALKLNDVGEILREVCRAIYESGEVEPLPTEEQINYGERIFADSEYLYVRLDVLLEKAKNYLRLWGIKWANFSKHAVLNELEAKELIETRGKTEGKRTLKLPGSKKNKQRFLYIRLEKILKMSRRD